MLAFAGIEDIEHIRGYVIDAVDFPQIGHAWVRIGNRYYDPTFDDPI
jgi:transglutaminase/protease-like cytokinesis protein 3